MENFETEILDNNSLSDSEKHHKNLLKNYTNLKSTSNYVPCKITNEYKCQIINTSEVSRAFNNYLQKLSSVSLKDEKLLEICQKIQTLHHGIQIDKNDEITVSGHMNENNLYFEKNVLQNENIIASFSEENIAELSSNSHAKAITTNILTSDDFLNTLTNEKEKIASIENDKKFQADKIAQNNIPTLQHSITEHLPCLERSGKEIQKIKNSSIKSNQTIYNTQLSIERPYVCSKCQKAFKRNLHLKRHFLVTHTPNKNFKCDTCEKLFSRKDYLDKHITGHQKKNLKIKLLEQGIVVRTKIFSKSKK